MRMSICAILVSMSSILRRFFFPTVLVCAIYFIKRRSWPGPVPPISEKNFQTAIFDLAAIRSLVPNSPTLPSTSIFTLFRVSAILFSPYFLLTYLVPMKVLLGISGTILFDMARTLGPNNAKSDLAKCIHSLESLFPLVVYLRRTPSRTHCGRSK